jgi:hypothetical protein
MLLSRFAPLSLILGCVGCATMVNGRHQDIQITTTPEHARIALDGSEIGKAPARIAVQRRGVHHLVVREDGYLAKEVELNGRFSNWTYLNALQLTSTYGTFTDFYLGGVWYYDEDRVHVTLSPLQAGARQEDVVGFVLTMRDQIRRECAAGGGESIDELMRMLGIPADERGLFLDRARRIAEQAKTDLDLAHGIRALRRQS